MGFLDWIFPKRCCGCNKTGQYFCYQCTQELLQKELICPNCKRPAIGGRTHPLCQKRYGLDGLWFLGAYQGALKSAIKKIKYRLIRDLIGELVDQIVIYLAKQTPVFLEEIKASRGENWLVVPVPLHQRRHNWRGFNQASELAKLIAAKTGLRYQDVLVRVVNTKPQAGLAGRERRENIKKAFQISPHAKNFHRLNILLVDDIWTTGSTCKECCLVLKRAGAKKVWALTLAR